MPYSTKNVQMRLHLAPVAGELVLLTGQAPTRSLRAERILIIGGGVTGLTVSHSAAPRVGIC